MPFKDVLNIMLPQQSGVSAHITGHYGEHRAKGPHGGSDFNYVGGQNGINLRNPTVHSPVAGEVTFVGGQYGTIKIRDADGNSHQILHTQSQTVAVGDRIEIADPIGTMGGRGPLGASQYAQHVHYQLKDIDGNLLSPEEYWNNRVVNVVTTPNNSESNSSRNAGEVLRQGESGSDVKHVQELLNKFGYRDSQGHPITSDGDFGQKTKEAVQAFQRARGLEDDGIIGAKTMEALKIAEQSPLLSSPNHPDHRLYQQALAGIEKLPMNSFQNDLERQNAAASIVFEARVGGLKQIDNVVLSNNGNGIFAIQGAMSDPAHHRIHIDKNQAAAEPVEKSTVQIQQEIQMPAQQAESEQRRVRVA
ncbi:MAG: XVIPCD domain-containing protein [Arenimonas sp.]